MPDDTTDEASICGFRYDLWDGPYVMRHECIAPAGHTIGNFAPDHGPWRYLRDAADTVPDGPTGPVSNASSPMDGAQ